jgi:hypothetical protein
VEENMTARVEEGAKVDDAESDKLVSVHEKGGE